MTCHRTLTNPSEWPVQCFTIQGVALFSWITMRKECRVTVTTLSFSENTGGHFLHEILKIDPAYLSWVAYKFTPKIPKQERFVKIAQAYHSIHLDIMIRKSREKRSSSRYLGELGEKLTDLKLKVTRVRLEDDPYKTRVNGTTPTVFCQADTDFNRCQWKPGYYKYSIKKSQCGFMHSIRDRT